MVKINQGLEIDDAIKFDDETDILKRKAFGESLSNLIINSENESLVISVNAEWGEGKTDFLKRFNNYLKDEKKLNTIYFNSFKNDFIDDPFVSLLGEILNVYKSDKEIYTKVIEKGGNILKGIIPLAGKIAGRVALGGDIEGVDNQMEKLIEGDIANQIGKTLQEYENKESCIKQFKDTLEEIIKEKGQLVFIIDELDRCRPDFALRLLERIKHFFDIKGLYFVLGINKNQIEAYIEKIYGKIDSAIYLQKFIDIETVLPKNRIKNEDYINYINSKLILTDGRKKELIGELLLSHFSNKDLSLRVIEKIVNYIILFEKSGYNYSPPILLILVLLKMYDYGGFIKIKEGENIKEQVVEFANFKEGFSTQKLEWVMENINIMFENDNDSAKEYIYNLEYFRIQD